MSYDKTKKKEETKRPSPKRKLSNITFEHDGAHLALVSKTQGGPANGHPKALVMKSTNNFSQEFIEKVQQVKVTLELPEFLRKFFNVYYEDAEVLARLMGYQEPDDDSESEDEVQSYDDYIEDYIQERLASFEIMKSLYDSKDITGSISKLQEQDYLSVLKDQEILEEIISKSQKTSTEGNSEVGANTEATVVAENPEPSLVLYKQAGNGGWFPTETKMKVNLEEKMTKQVTKAQVEVEVVEKSALEAIEKAAKEEKELLEKALADQKEALQKALETVQKFEQEKKEQIIKSRFNAVQEAVKDKEVAEVLFKAVGLVQDEVDFESVVKALKKISDLAETSSLFVEKGVSGESGEDPTESSLSKLINKKYNVK